jgi:phosphatidylserine/phosphatidylglycerophosphate/cardiolipin synthase-like enzyme
VLRPDGPAQQALLAAARRGAHVVVTLQREPWNDPDGAVFNARSAHALSRAGAHVTLLDREQARFHLKAAVCDGVAYLDDRNWTKHGHEIVVADDAARDVALVRAAVTRRAAGSDRTLALRKDAVLARETALIRSAGDAPVIVESEYADESPLVDALRKHAERGAPAMLILGRGRRHGPREPALIASLRRAGVDVRETGINEKLALVGNRAWIGSANATVAASGIAGQIEWGVVTRKRELVKAVAAALRRDARPSGSVR